MLITVFVIDPSKYMIQQNRDVQSMGNTSCDLFYADVPPITYLNASKELVEKHKS